MMIVPRGRGAAGLAGRRTSPLNCTASTLRWLSWDSRRGRPHSARTGASHAGTDGGQAGEWPQAWASRACASAAAGYL